MWAEGSIKIENSIFHYWVKHYEGPSEDFKAHAEEKR